MSETVQASAFSFNGPSFSAQEFPIDFISYVNKPLSESFKHFGTRMRIIGKIENNISSIQTAAGASTYYNITPKTSETNPAVSGGGGGIATLLNPETNNGYYFEIAALSESNVDQYKTEDGVSNVFFYKIMKNESFDHDVTVNLPGAYASTQLSSQTNASLAELIDGVAVGQRVFLSNQSQEDEIGYYEVTSIGSESSKWVLTRDEAGIPFKLWSGLSTIIVDNGNFAGQSRVVAEDFTTVYDLAVEYEDFASGVRRFYLYLNDSQIATIDDPTPLPVYNNMALFVRGGSSCMFENVYALANNYTKNSSYALEPIANSVFIGYPRGIRMNQQSVYNNYAANTGVLTNNVLAAPTTTFSIANPVGNMTATATDIATLWNGTNETITNTDLPAVYAQLGLNSNIAFGVNVTTGYAANPTFAVTAGTLTSGASFTHPKLTNSFFTTTTYRGAFGATDWTDGWAEFLPNAKVY
jgi:hypothetical protein